MRIILQKDETIKPLEKKIVTYNIDKLVEWKHFKQQILSPSNKRDLNFISDSANDKSSLSHSKLGITSPTGFGLRLPRTVSLEHFMRRRKSKTKVRLFPKANHSQSSKSTKQQQ